MLDESMFEDIHEIAENSAYLKAVEQKDVSLEMLYLLPPYEDCRELEEKLRIENKLTFEAIFNEATGYYLMKCFLVADYAVDKAIFIKDVEAYKSMRFESARRKVATLLYQRFVSTDEHEYKHGISVFQIIQQSKGSEEKKERDGKVQPASINLSASPSHAQSMELKTIIPPSSPLHSSANTTSNGHNVNNGSIHSTNLSSLHLSTTAVNGHPSPHTLPTHLSASTSIAPPITPSSPSHAASTLLQMGTNNNPIGVYGKSVRLVREKVTRGEAPKDLFDEVARDVMTDLKLDAFPRFKQGDFYKRYIRTKWIETQKVLVKDFTTFRVLGRGGFGAVHACRKKNSGQIYAMKCFPEDDMRVLTNRGFLFLDQLQEQMKMGGLTFAAYEVATDRLVYVPGVLQLPPGDVHQLVNITEHSTQLSMRVTADHHLYVQRGHTVASNDKTITWSPAAKLEAQQLLTGCSGCTDVGCVHRSAHARFIGVAASGVAVDGDGDGDVDALLFSSLGFTSSHQVDAFMELYGRWLTHGSLDQHSVVYSHLNDEDVASLRLQLSACGLQEGSGWLLEEVEGQEGVNIRVVDEAWFALFESEYGAGGESEAGDVSTTSAEGVTVNEETQSARWFCSWVLTRLGLRRLQLIVRGLSGEVNECSTRSLRFRDELMQVLMHAGYSCHFDLQHEVGAVWRVRWSTPHTEAGERVCWPVVRCHDHVQAEEYHGRVWCVTVQHPDHLVVAQRAFRADGGEVTTTSRPVIVGQCINKKLVKVKSALDNVLEERNVLTMMKSHFVTNLKYGLQDEDTLYLIMDLMLGGDLKFHLINAGRFTEKRARFYAAQVLLGLEHVHKLSIIYRDMKLENVLLDHQGHCRLSDLGLAVVTKVKIKGYAGTPGYTAPEMIKNKLYGPAADIFSYGVMLYRMLCGSKPFKGKVDRDLDKAVIERKPTFPKEIFSKEAISLLTGLLQKRPENRLGCGERGIEEIKEHPFFESIDWGLLEAGYIDPPFVPNKFDVNAASLKDIGDFDRAKYKHVKLDDRFKQRIKNFEYVNVMALQDEMVQVLEKADENINFEKFAQQPPVVQQPPPQNGPACCTIT